MSGSWRWKRVGQAARATVVLVAAGLVAAGLVAAVGCGPRSVPEPERMVVRVEPARELDQGRASQGTAYLATVKGRSQVTLSFRVPGIVDRVGPGEGSGDWEEGASVRRGQLLAQLKQSDFLAASNSAAAQAELDLTQFQRTAKLLQDGAASQQEYDRALAAKRASEAALELRRQEWMDSQIVAPFTGTILKREVNAGETVGAGQPVLTMADLSVVEVDVGVPERLVGRLAVGREVALTISALGNEAFRGDVREVGVAAREGSRLFRVVVTVPNPDGRIRPGMAASVMLGEEAVPRSGVLVRLSALVGRGDRQLAVFVVTNGVARERLVQTGDIVESSIQVTRALQPGEWVVVAGASQLYDGAPVEVVGD